MKIKNWICIMFLGAGILASGCSNECLDTVNVEQREEIAQSEDIETSRGIEKDLAELTENDEKLAAEQQKQEEVALRFEESIKALDEILADCKSRGTGLESYAEDIGTIYLFNQEINGQIQAWHDGKTIVSLQMFFGKIVEVEEETTVSDAQEFMCYPLENGKVWFTYRTTGDMAELPDYVVNEDVLRYYRQDYYGKADEITEFLNGADYSFGQEMEFLYEDGVVYRIDRENKLIRDVTEEKDACFVEFILPQLERIRMQLNVNEDVLDIVEKWKPQEYCLLDDWDMIGVDDLNHDGELDYVLALYPKEHEEEKRYEGFSPYEHTPEYYASEFWLLLSDGEGGCEQINLTDTIEYREDALVLVSLEFVEEGLLELEYFVGRSPFADAVIQFRYEKEEKGFYIERSFYREGYSQIGNRVLIGDVSNYGQLSMYGYFAQWNRYYERAGTYESDLQLENGIEVKGYFNGFEYRCDNLLTEQHVMSMIWGVEHDFMQMLLPKYENIEMWLDAHPLFYSQHLVSGYMEVNVEADVVRDENAQKSSTQGERIDSGYINIPIMIDKQTGELIQVTELIGKDAFVELFQKWAKDLNNKGAISEEEKELCINILSNNWEKADSLEHFTEFDGQEIFLAITQEGVVVGLWSDGDSERIRQEFYRIDKEHFIGTELWEYMEPEF